jgi:hypothetical protein
MDASLKEKDREREKENADRDREREREKEKEREGDVEAALYANCLLLGLDPTVLGPGAGMRAGLFRHSNPRLGEALLHFLMCALRGPNLSAKVISSRVLSYLSSPFLTLNACFSRILICFIP